MLSANIETGLKYSLSMGYHEEDRTRTAFMQVLTNILKQGTEFAVLSESAMEDRYEKLIDLIASPDLTLVLSLCNVCPVSEIDDLAIVLLNVFASRGLTMPLLKAVIVKEVRETGTQKKKKKGTTLGSVIDSFQAIMDVFLILRLSLTE